MDVKTVFLNGNLLEDVYMTQPEGFVNPKNSGKVCKLQRSIYGLKQASRSQNLRFDEAVKEFGFIKNEDEPCAYKKVSGSAVVFLVLYVDDILLIGLVSLRMKMNLLSTRKLVGAQLFVQYCMLMTYYSLEKISLLYKMLNHGQGIVSQ